MRKGIKLLTALTLALILFCSIQTQFVKAQLPALIYIKTDGSVDPATAPIQQVGNTYKLTNNIYNTSLVILKNNILLDGQGFMLGSGKSTSSQAAINLTCTNVVVTNFHIASWQVGVLGVFDGNTIIGNNFTNNGYDVAIYANNYKVTRNYLSSERIVGNNNVISQNEISVGDYVSAFWISSSSGTIIEANDITLTKETHSFISTDNGNFQVYHNNFLNIEKNTGGCLLFIIPPRPLLNTNITPPPWDNGYPSGGNYWSDYTSSRYPDYAGRYTNATEIDNSGIGNTPYVSITAPTGVIDRYPLMTPYNFSKPIMLSQPNPSPTPSLTPLPSIPEFPTWIASLLIVSTILLLAFIKRKKF